MRRLLGTIVLALGVATSAVVQGQQPLRTEWGTPDLRGIWNNGTLTPIERPDALGDKTHFTPEETEAMRGTGLARLLERFRDTPEWQTSGELNEIFLDPGTEVVRSRSTSLVVDPPDGKIPFTPDARQRRIHSMLQLVGLAGSLDSYEHLHMAARCLWAGTFYAPTMLYLNNHQIFQTPDHVAILSEYGPQVRVVPLDGRPPLNERIAERNGSSRGYWEGDTLVIETANFAARPNPFPAASAGLRLVERLTRFDEQTIDYSLTVTDAASYTRPWTLENTLRAAPGPVYEFACHEGN